MITPTNRNWLTPDDNHDGGQSYGPGFCIAWQRGPLNEAGRNGAFLIEVPAACKFQLEHYQSGRFACPENAAALEHLNEAIDALDSRRSRRAQEGKFGTTEV